MFVYDSYLEAHRELQRLSKNGDGAGLVHRIVKSPFGGYRIVSLPPSLYVDMLSGRMPALRGIKESIYDGLEP